MSLRERLAMVAVYALVFGVLPALMIFPERWLP
jgi:hypothetical protein